MKHTKKALALLMVLVMSLSLLTVTAFAAGTGKITIENATAGMEYKLYKVFDASYIDGTVGGTKPAVRPTRSRVLIRGIPLSKHLAVPLR